MSVDVSPLSYSDSDLIWIKFHSAWNKPAQQYMIATVNVKYHMQVKKKKKSFANILSAVDIYS